ncbi:hypothetical protein BCR44DRAFT_349181 [Catenaria anguillulae PL171]|uniref:Uncharacterized protein n=1 Tax=Catenaria anguillulae PL171 TaxID=765915 RepID=A0A1Y2I5C0_9FUNG|nr:hypothetical protein BCR44DRAFT_349181 [Catenaria anguillulae PL171]
MIICLGLFRPGHLAPATSPWPMTAVGPSPCRLTDQTQPSTALVTIGPPRLAWSKKTEMTQVTLRRFHHFSYPHEAVSCFLSASKSSRTHSPLVPPCVCFDHLLPRQFTGRQVNCGLTARVRFVRRRQEARARLGPAHRRRQPIVARCPSMLPTQPAGCPSPRVRVWATCGTTQVYDESRKTADVPARKRIATVSQAGLDF